MTIDERFVFYVIGWFVGVVSFEVFRVIEIWRRRRNKEPVRERPATNEGYRKFVDNWRKHNFNK